MNLYDASVPVLISMHVNLSGILANAKDWVIENRKSDEDVLQVRLAPDMFPLVRQVQIVSDNMESVSARLAGEDPPIMEDAEATSTDHIERSQKTVAYLKTLDPAMFEGAKTRRIPFPHVPDTYLLGQEALLKSYLKNFFFYVTTAFDILRSQGVPLGKADFIGVLPLKPNENT